MALPPTLYKYIYIYTYSAPDILSFSCRVAADVKVTGSRVGLPSSSLHFILVDVDLRTSSILLAYAPEIGGICPQEDTMG